MFCVLKRTDSHVLLTVLKETTTVTTAYTRSDITTLLHVNLIVKIRKVHHKIKQKYCSKALGYKAYDFDFEIVNFPFLDGDVPRSTSYGVYIS